LSKLNHSLALGRHSTTLRTFPHEDISEATIPKRKINAPACKEREEEGRVTLKDMRLWV
jgi:hypothetical protein